MTEECAHKCVHCGKKETDLFFSMTRDAKATAIWYPPLRSGITAEFTVGGVSGGPPYGITLKPVNEEPPVIPPPPPQVWLVFKHGGSYRPGSGLQGIYTSQDVARKSLEYWAKCERQSLADALGIERFPWDGEQPELKWGAVHYDKYGPIPGYSATSAGTATFFVEHHYVEGEKES